MTTLTKEQRHEVYKLALKTLQSENPSFWTGCCYHLNNALIELKHGFPCNDYRPMLKSLPEFSKHGPSKNAHDEYWFETTKERVECLTQCIEETKP